MICDQTPSSLFAMCLRQKLIVHDTGVIPVPVNVILGHWKCRRWNYRVKSWNTSPACSLQVSWGLVIIQSWQLRWGNIRFFTRGRFSGFGITLCRRLSRLSTCNLTLRLYDCQILNIFLIFKENVYEQRVFLLMCGLPKNYADRMQTGLNWCS